MNKKDFCKCKHCKYCRGKEWEREMESKINSQAKLLRTKMVDSGKWSPEEFDSRIKSKVEELSGLISEEAAACVIANQLGIVAEGDKNE